MGVWAWPVPAVQNVERRLRRDNEGYRMAYYYIWVGINMERKLFKAAKMGTCVIEDVANVNANIKFPE